MAEPPTSSPAIFTVGHSNHDIASFLDLLQGAGVTAIADVRSAPFSKFVPQFNRGNLTDELARHGIAYRFFGKYLGARPADRESLEGGRVSFDRLARSELFLEGLQRVVEGARRHRIALMCAERDPLECHRAILVARCLADRGVAIMHIHGDGQLESHAAAEQRLLARYAMTSGDLFLAPEEQMARAYARRASEIAWHSDEAEEVGVERMQDTADARAFG